MRYDRDKVVEYARKHAGDITSAEYQSGADANATAFASRCIGVGFGKSMEFNNADLLYKYLIKNIARECTPGELLAGDIIQISTGENIPYKSLVVTKNHNEILYVCASSYKVTDAPITKYINFKSRCLHIL